MLKISIVVPTFNEENNIEEFLYLLLNQSYSADEILICDGDSSDKTVSIINKIKDKNDIIKIVKRKGKCRGSGRNSAIKEAKNDFIALIDAGTKPKLNWLEQLVKSLKNNNSVECIYGSVTPLVISDFTECLSVFFTGKKTYNGRITRSVASIIISKKLWKNIGGFPESKKNKFVVEDLIFLENIEKNKYKFIENFNAEVFWMLPDNLTDVFNKFKVYFYGGLFTGHAKKITTLRNLILNLVFISLSLTYNIFFLFFIFFYHLLRSNSYFNNSYWIKKSFNLNTIKKYILVSLQLLVIDIATYYGLIKYYIMLKWIKSQ